nr:methionine ABC transporter ATP-binding protein [Caulobacter sp. 17J80-11]
MKSPPDAIAFEDVRKAFAGRAGEVAALDGVSLSVRRGEVFGVIGRSGAGKSTLVRLINRLERPTGGRVLVGGEDVGALDAAGLRTLRRRIGMIFQHFGLLSSKTVADNVAYPLKLEGKLSRREVGSRVAELLARVGLSDHARKYPAQLSGGQKQRVGIARALATRPDILLCDEATSALDPETTREILQLVAGLNRELGLTVVLITHEMEVVRQVCDRVAVLDAGRLAETGPVADVFLAPQHPTTRALVSEAEHLEDEAADLSAASGRIVRLTYRGEAAYRPLLGQVARETGVDFSILSGRVARIKDTPYGQLTLSLEGGDVDGALARFRAADVQVEAVR